MVGAFSLKFSIAPSVKTRDQIKNSWGECKHGTDLLYHHAKYGEIVGRTPAVNEKV